MLDRRGLFGVFLLLAIFVGLHVGFAPEHHEPSTTAAVMLGGIAFLLMSTSVILATRARILESAFGGLDRMYQVHKLSGISASLFVLLHFFTIPKKLPLGVDPISNPLAPSGPLGMVALILLVISIGLALNRKISYNRWRGPHKAMGLVYVLVIGHFMTAPGIFFEKFSVSGYFLIVVATIGLVSLLYSLFGMNRATGRRFKIEAVNTLERATELVLSPLEETMTFTAGQFAFVEIQDKGWSEPHPFTVSSSPNEPNLRFTMKVLGDWTRKVREGLEPGGEVIVRGPYGRFDSAQARPKQIWLAGGIGITPFLSKVRAMSADDIREITLVYATRNRAEALFLDELRERASDLPRFRIVTLFSDESEFARVEKMKEEIDGQLSDFDFFLCGPKPMLKALTKDLKSVGVSGKTIHTEAFEFR